MSKTFLKVIQAFLIKEFYAPIVRKKIMIILFDSLLLFKYRKKIMAPFRCSNIKTNEEIISLTYFRSVNAVNCLF